MSAAPTRRLRHLHALAWALVLLALAVVAVSAWVRLSGAGLGCADWPACYGRLLTEGGSTHVGAIRVVHRALATLALLLGFAAVWPSLRPEPVQPAARQATLLVVLMLVLSAFGIWSADARRVLPGFVNILGGLALVSLSLRLLLATRPGVTTAVTAERPDPTMHVGAMLLGLTVALGALIGARYAASACTTLPFCADTLWPAVAGWAALNPVATLSAATPAGDAGGVALHLLHRYAAAAATLALGWAAVRALRAAPARCAPKAVLALALLVAVLGIWTVASGYSLLAAVLHSLAAAALLAAVAAALRR